MSVLPAPAVRPARADDEPFVLATAERLSTFDAPSWRTPHEIVAAELRTLRGFFVHPADESALLIAESEAAEPRGFIYLETHTDYFTAERHGHVGIIAVSADAEGRGVGAALMRAAEAWAVGRGFRRLTLNVFDANHRARRVYEHLGYSAETLRYVKPL